MTLPLNTAIARWASPAAPQSVEQRRADPRKARPADALTRRWVVRAKKQDCWSVTVRLSIPIDATKPETIGAAQKKVRELASLIPGCAVELTHAGFGRMAAATQVVTVAQPAAQQGTLLQKHTEHPAEPEIPEYLRRVPRHDGIGRGTPMDPSGDGSYRGPDGAA